MTLRQAYENWSGHDDNKLLAVKSLPATRRCFLTKYGDTPLKDITRDYAMTIFATCKEMKDVKVKAAAVFVYVMKWVNAKTLDIDCPVCDYTYTDLAKATVLPEQEKTAKTREKEKSEAKEPGTKAEPTPVKKTRTRKDSREVVIVLNPETMELGQRFKSVTEAHKATKVSNIDRYCKSHRPNKGIYFAYANELEGWKPAAIRVGQKGKRGGSRFPLPIFRVSATDKNDVARYDSVNQAAKANNIPRLSAKVNKDILVGGSYFMTEERYRDFLKEQSDDGQEAQAGQESVIGNNESAQEEFAAAPSVSTEFSISSLTDKDIIDECRRRGWKGDIFVHVIL